MQVFDSQGSFLSYVNTSRDPLYGPQGLAITEDGSIVVSDSGNHCFKVYKHMMQWKSSSAVNWHSSGLNGTDRKRWWLVRNGINSSETDTEDESLQKGAAVNANRSPTTAITDVMAAILLTS